jgi:hypothetical protein
VRFVPVISSQESMSRLTSVALRHFPATRKTSRVKWNVCVKRMYIYIIYITFSLIFSSPKFYWCFYCVFEILRVSFSKYANGKNSVALCSEPPYIRNRLMFGTAVCSEPPYVRNRPMFGTALSSEPPYVRYRLMFGTALCSEPPYVRNHLIFGLTR